MLPPLPSIRSARHGIWLVAYVCLEVCACLLTTTGLAVACAAAPQPAPDAAPDAAFGGLRGEVEAQAGEGGGRPWIEHIDAATYDSWRGNVHVAHSQNWAVAQDAQGVLYVANGEGLLSYDGARWQALPVQAGDATAGRGAYVRSLATLPEGHPDAGRVLVAAVSTFGRLVPEPATGRLVYDALSDRLPPDEAAALGTTWKASATTRAAYFLTPTRLFRWRADTLHAWTPRDLTVPPGADASAFAAPDDREFFFSFVVRDTLYVQVTGAGLFRADGDRLHLLPGGERFADDGIYALLPYGDHSLLIGVRGQGLFAHDGRTARALRWPVEPWLREHQLYHGARLADGTYAFATRRGGLVLVTADGQPRYVLDDDAGLGNDKVHFVFEDRAGSLWLALNDGLARVDRAAPYRYFDDRLGLPSYPHALARHAGTLFAGTPLGLYRLRPAPAGAPARFERVPGFASECTDLASTPAGLLVATQDDLVVWTPEGRAVVPGATQPESPRVLWLRPPAAGGTGGEEALVRGYVGYASGGIRPLRREGGRWRLGARLPGVEMPAYELVEDADGALWAAGDDDGAVRVRRPLGPAPEVTHFGRADGLPALFDLKIHRVGDRLFFGTRRGLYRLDGARFVPDSTFGADWAGGAAFVTHLVAQGDSLVWGRAADLSAEGSVTLAPLRRGADGRWRRGAALPPFRATVARALLPDARGGLWVGHKAPRALAYVHPRVAFGAAPASRRPPLIRAVYAGAADSLVAVGFGRGPAVEAAPVRLAPGTRSFAVAAALPAFAHTDAPAYRARLAADGRGAWSRWSSDATARFARPAPGRYRVEVQARTANGAVTSVAALPLVVEAPWHRTPWALALGALVAAGTLASAGAGVVRWRMRRLQAQQARLQRKVDAQTAELHAQTAALRDEKQRTSEALAVVAEQKERLAALDRAKSEFFANVSHEFRTPLTLALGLLEEWTEPASAAGRVPGRPPLPDAAQRDLRQVLLSNRRLLRLVNQLLDIARLESEALTLRVRPLRLATLVEGLAHAFAPLAERRRVAFTRHLPPPDAALPEVVGDPEQVEIIVTNLLSNAFKFTPPGGTVTLTLRRAQHGTNAERGTNADESTNADEAARAGEDAVEVVVADTGPGIAEAEQARIFERFHRAVGPPEAAADAPPAGAPPLGTGIGLALARGLAERHGGTLTVASTPGAGATFTLRLLPGRARFDDRPDVVWADDEEATQGNDAPVADVHGTSEDLIASEAIAGEDLIAGEAVAGEAVAGAHPEAYDDRPTVLVVDDHADIRAFVRRHLAPTYRVAEAADGRAGLAAARRLTPDVVVSDVRMPEMDGRAMLAALRRDPATAFLPVVLLTARAAPEDKLEGLEAGADDYLTKPFRPAELRARIRNLLAQRMRLRERFLAERDEGERAAAKRDAAKRAAAERDAAKRSDDAAPSPEAADARDAAAPPFLRAVEATIQTHLADEDFSVADLAAAVGVSRSKLYRDLRAVTDASPADLIWRVRVETARRLLATGEGTVSEVAYGVGFKSVTHFSRRFREYHGTAPSEVTPAA